MLNPRAFILPVLSLAGLSFAELSNDRVSITNPDGGNGTDYTGFYRSDAGVDNGNLRLNVGDDGGSEDIFDVGYQPYWGGSWVSTLQVRASGNVKVRNALGVGVDPTETLDINGNTLARGKLSFQVPSTQYQREPIFFERIEGSMSDMLMLRIGSGNQPARAWNSFGIAGANWSGKDAAPFMVRPDGSVTAAYLGVTYEMSAPALTVTNATITNASISGDLSIQRINYLGSFVSQGDMTVKGKLFVGTSGWSITAPDFVFDSSYSLISLDSLSAFVQLRKHLPGIQSAQDFEKNGKTDLIEMNMKLLEKIEELTLYVGQLHERLKLIETSQGGEKK